MMKIFDSSLMVTNREAEFKPILSAILDPLIQSCTLSSSKLGLSEMAVYMINCLQVIQWTISKYDFTKSRLESLSQHMKSYMDSLVAEQTGTVLRQFDIGNKITLMQSSNGVKKKERFGKIVWKKIDFSILKKVAFSKVPSLDYKSIQRSVKSFERLLEDPNSLVLPQVDRLLDPQIRNVATHSVSQLIYDSYTTFYNAVLDPKNEYPNPQSLFSYDPQQVKTMLGAL